MLYDKLLVALADPRRRLRAWIHSDMQARAWLHQLSGKIKRATRFTLSDEFTDMVETVSLCEPLKLAWLYQKARAPYDLMWIEWNVGPRIEAERRWRTEHGHETPLPPIQDIQAGVLIERETRYARESVYRAFYFTDEGDGPVGWPIGIIWDPQGMEVESLRNFVDRRLNDFLMVCKTNPVNYLLGAVWMAVHAKQMLPDPTLETPKATRFIFAAAERTALEYIFDSTLITCAGSAGKWILDASADAKFITDKGITTEGFKLAQNMLEESNGDLRWMISLLGIINTQPVHIGGAMSPQYISNQIRVIGGKQVPYLMYKTLTVALPSERIIKRVAKMNVGLIRKRRHQVRGHYRTYQDGHKVWVHQHERGDASIGWVMKNYLLEPS